jgi:TolB-like protein/Tfp pilus assembly protein PilF
MADVFVSYARTDKALVAPLVAALQAHGCSVWWDPAITPGQEFDRLISRELESAAAVLVVWTATSVESRWVRGEARDGADRGVLVPVRIGEARLPIDFRAFHTIELGDQDVEQRGPAFQEALGAILALVERGRAGGESATVAQPSILPPPALRPEGGGKVGICVVPFTTPRGDGDEQIFSDGIAEDIIRELSRWRSLAVRSRSASFRFRGAAADTSQIARELNVRYVVAGSVRRMGERIRISVELIDTGSGSQVWGERFDRTQAQLFDVQDEVVQKVASTVVGRVQVTDVERTRRKPPASLDAYECVLQGNALPWDDPSGAAEAFGLFEKAIELDPGYAIARALLATMLVGQWRTDDQQDDALLERAYGLAKLAVELDDGESTCHSLLAHVCMYKRWYELALQHMQRSVAINPNNPWNMADMGLVLAYAGDPHEALDWFVRAKATDPYFDPPWHWRQAGVAHMVVGQFERALEMFAHVAPRSFRVWAYVAACHARLGQADRARDAVRRCLELYPQFGRARFMTREPFRDPANATSFAESLRLAGLPE